MNPKAYFYFSKAQKWQEEFKELRKIILGCQLSEELKWGCACYTAFVQALDTTRGWLRLGCLMQTIWCRLSGTYPIVWVATLQINKLLV